MSTAPSIVVPDGFTLHTENTSHLLLSSNEAFLNPVQEFNRDLSVACIRIWSEELNLLKETRWKLGQEKKANKANARKRQKVENGASVDVVATESAEQEAKGVLQKEPQYRPYKVVILEALSATGLRSIRYAKEIPLVKYVIANDLSSAATAAMRRNVKSNGFQLSSTGDGKIRINEGDACTLMYNHREERQRVDVVDLDPYGTAASFIDAAVQSVNDGGLLCVTCTDLSVLATNNYPEKCLSNYGGIPVKSEYCHEAALRLVLHAVSASASRYGRYIEPLLSLSIDFYVRLFIKVHTSAVGVKKALTKISAYFVCTSCQSFYEQPLGRVTEKKHETSGNINYNFRTHPGPVVSDRCPECESALHIAGPMWSGPIHDTDFVAKVLEHVEGNPDSYGTSTRMKGMLTVAKEELHTPFYFTPTRVASFFHCQTPSLDEMASALLHAGYLISRSHATPGSLKTTATRADLHDIFRSFVKLHPVKLENVSEASPARKLLAKEPKTEANFKRHPQSVTASSKVKLVRYQETPQNWGPGSRAVSGTGSKRKRKAED
ncbi:N2,N2-dimethylguanosine tRNA methyltransferase [Guyanagaster necrorhizus]|uniref:tRNA (guanine(26)-N(2))-dimethyltransferase n=1 Tax=Guyanagaster necrorhizus TaxID=856835 RepID=A0A9P7W5F1_9AGAR|nr:N2,N2-dimethylguanosine tRNA methyltransferase [Guyanagaster necrorhizus MCA 3950]KAG7452487.1 N2,N2-dimethylguanosine tRNA methyltransferase [Guyanagaster necrorhizus MCA 3950]